MKYSNTTMDILIDNVRSIFEEMHNEGNFNNKKRISKMKNNTRNDVCQYALDTGEKAFINMPCRGNRIICQHPDNKDFVSYTKACNPGMCKFFKQKEEKLE